MSMIVFGLRSWPARSTTRRNYSSIAEPVSGYSALCANYAASTPDTKFCQWSTRIKLWRYWFPALSTVEMGGTHFAGCVSKNTQIFLFYTQKSRVTLFVSEQNKVTHSLNRTETFVSVKFSQWYNRHFRTCHMYSAIKQISVPLHECKALFSVYTIPCISAVNLTGQDYKGDELHSVQSGHSAGSDYTAGEFHYTDWGNSFFGHHDIMMDILYSLQYIEYMYCNE